MSKQGQVSIQVHASREDPQLQGYVIPGCTLLIGLQCTGLHNEVCSCQVFFEQSQATLPGNGLWKFS